MLHFTLKHRTTPVTVVVPTLSALTLAASSVVEGTATGTTIGGILGKSSGSSLILSDDAGGRFAISGTNLITGLTPTDYETATSHSITIIETLNYSGGTVTHSTTLTITVVNVFEKPNLGSLAFSQTAFTVGTPVSGSITGATAGSTISSPDVPASIVINSAARTWSYDGTGTAVSASFTLVETLTDSANSPKSSIVNYTLSSATMATPVLTMTSVSGTNPPTWDALMANLQDGDSVQLDYSTDGSTPDGVAEATIIFDARDETVNWGSAWPNPFPGGVTIKWRERYGRLISGSMVWSAWSNILSDTMPSSGAVLTPIASTPANQSTSSTTHTFPSIAFGAGKLIIAVSSYFLSGVVLRPTGTTGASDITLTLIGNAGSGAGRDDATMWWSPVTQSAGNYDIIVTHTSAQGDCSVFGWTGTGITTVGTVFGIAAGVSSTDYSGTVPTLASGAAYAAVAHVFADSAVSWSGASTPTKDVEQQAIGTMSCAHGNTAGDIHAVPFPGGFGGMTGVVFNP